MANYREMNTQRERERKREIERERDRQTESKEKNPKQVKKNATCVRLYVLYNINAHHSRLCTWSPWKILLNDVHAVLFYYSFGVWTRIQKYIETNPMFVF